MRVLLQRVSEASVVVEREVVGRIGPGFLALVGVGRDDDEAVVAAMAAKVANLRVFADEQGKMNRSLLDLTLDAGTGEAGGAVLAVSQFTLYADCRKGRRPNFMDAAGPESGLALFNHFVGELRRLRLTVETGRFGAMMQVALVNDGPVTIWLDSKDIL